MAKKKKANIMLDLLRQTRDRTWVMKPITQVVPNRKKEKSRKACRGKVVD
jgi:hypothetical protein